MNPIPDPNHPHLKEGITINEYLIQRMVHLKEINAFLYSLEHIPTHAKHIHISNQDTENTFSVGFKTVPRDSTGVAHILEHTVLCGSKKFSIRDPFFSMLKRSLNTFMNAFTASDWTMYPFSTQNEKDYYNLMDVYLDSAFFPIIDELSFKQEGHRLEIEYNDRDKKAISLAYKGVVYNEMKGAMSSPQQVMVRSLMEALYPSTTYRHNSGGDPAAIPHLTHDQLKAFHKRHYHPSNAFFYTYGNLPLQKHLQYIHDNVLKYFRRIDPKTDVPSQPRWKQPKKVTYTYPLGKNEAPLKKCQVCLAWLTADIKDTFEVLSLTLLERILLGNAASPLRKALIDSEIGTALSDGTGYDRDNRDTLFSCGLKDVVPSSAKEIETIIFKVLEELYAGGIEKKLIDSAIHQIEFHRKEITNAPYPYGIQLLLVSSGSWFHGTDPARVLQIDDDLEKIRQNLSRGPFFEEMIKRYFLDNPHRVLLTLVPDQSMEQKEAERVSSELERIKADLMPADLEKIKKEQDALKQLQDANESLSCLPTLELDDIPPQVKRIEEKHMPAANSVVGYCRPTSGIFYFSSAFGIGDVDKEHLALIPIFSYVFSKIGTSKHNYVQMAQWIDAYTGGVGMSSHARTGYQDENVCVPFVSVNGKSLNRNQDKLFEIVEALIVHFNVSDLNRLRTLLFQYRAALESKVVSFGHRLAMSLASRTFSKTRILEEMWHGVHQLTTIKQITDNLTDQTLQSISEKLGLIGKTIFSQDNLKIALIGEDRALEKAALPAGSIQSGLPAGQVDGYVLHDLDADEAIPYEGWSTSSAVSFVAGTFKTVRMSHEDGPALFVISKLLRSMYLHREIREKGGAYGGFAIYNPEDGIFSLGSYRDPHIVSTLRVYDGVENFMSSGAYDGEDVKEAILQACSEIDKPDSPGSEGQKAFYRKIIGLSDDGRQRFKEGVLAVTRNQVIAVAGRYFDLEQNKRAVAVISGEAQLKQANDRLDTPLKLYRI